MRRIVEFILVFAVCWFAVDVARAADISAPAHAIAGNDVSLSTNGGGSATLYVFGPGTASKKDVHLGDKVSRPLKLAGRYTAVINGEAVQFDVAPSQPAEVAFLARPSRVPSDRKDVI